MQDFPTMNTWKAINKKPIGAKMAAEVFDDDNNWGVSADIEPGSLYMGDGMYEALAKGISRGRIIYDFGASYGFQSWHFRHHKKYIAVQPEDLGKYGSTVRFRTDNSVWFMGRISEFLDQFEIEQQSFAICNAVPSDEVALVRAACPYLFVNYPESCDFV